MSHDENCLQLFCLVLITGGIFAQDTTEETETISLKGLHGVRVLVERIRPELKRHGLTEDQLQTDTEIKLRKAGIPVLTEATWLAEPGKPFLYVEVSAYNPTEATYMFATTVQLEQELTLIRATPQQRYQVFGVTWKDRGIGAVDAKSVRSIREQRWGLSRQIH